MQRASPLSVSLRSTSSFLFVFVAIETVDDRNLRYRLPFACHRQAYSVAPKMGKVSVGRKKPRERRRSRDLEVRIRNLERRELRRRAPPKSPFSIHGEVM